MFVGKAAFGQKLPVSEDGKGAKLARGFVTINLVEFAQRILIVELV